MADFSEWCLLILNKSPLKYSKSHLLFALRCTVFDRYLLHLQLLFNGGDSDFWFCVLVELQVRWEEQSDYFSAANYANKSSQSGFQKLKKCHVHFSFFSSTKFPYQIWGVFACITMAYQCHKRLQKEEELKLHKGTWESECYLSLIFTYLYLSKVKK